jgi:uncharacterized damage-inducible protein DinB
VVAAARDNLSRSLAELRKAVQGCSADQLNRRPAGSQTNGLAVLATHALASTRSWLSLATAAPLPDRNRDDEFLVLVKDAETFVNEVDAVSEQCRSLLAGDPAFDPVREVTAPWRSAGSDEPVTAAWALLHALEHLREHVGHAQLTKDVIAQG